MFPSSSWRLERGHPDRPSRRKGFCAEIKPPEEHNYARRLCRQRTLLWPVFHFSTPSGVSLQFYINLREDSLFDSRRWRRVSFPEPEPALLSLKCAAFFRKSLYYYEQNSMLCIRSDYDRNRSSLTVQHCCIVILLYG
jgi:hypothetical protein